METSAVLRNDKQTRVLVREMQNIFRKADMLWGTMLSGQVDAANPVATDASGTGRVEKSGSVLAHLLQITKSSDPRTAWGGDPEAAAPARGANLPVHVAAVCKFGYRRFGFEGE